MARQSNESRPNSSGSFKIRYIDLNPAERDSVEHYQTQHSPILHADLEQFVSDGWKVSINYSTSWRNWVISISPKEVKEYPSNFVYIFRHADFERCCGYIRYFFSELAPNGDARLRDEADGYSW